MNRLTDWRGGALVLALLLLCGCVASPTPELEGRDILVTFSLPTSGGTPAGGSRHLYRAGDNWQVPLSTRARVEHVAGRYGLREVSAWPIHSLALYCVRYRLPDGLDIAELTPAIAGEPDVSHAQALHVFNTLGIAVSYDDPYFNVQYGPQREGLARLHRYTRGSSVRVGVVDTGVDDTHPDLRGRLARAYPFTGRQRGQNLQHGTAVAGVIGAAANNREGIVGLAPEAELYAYAACRASPGQAASCNSFDLAKALEQAVADDIAILNLSLAGPRDALLADLLDVLLARSVIVIAAADSEEIGRGFPASHPGVISAGSSAGVARRQPVSLPGPPPSLVERREWLSTLAGGGYQFFQGASMTSAGLTGLATLVRALLPGEEARRITGEIAGGGCARVFPDIVSGFLADLDRALDCGRAQPAVAASDMAPFLNSPGPDSP